MNKPSAFKSMPLFTYSNYWKNWSRVLTRGEPSRPYMEALRKMRMRGSTVPAEHLTVLHRMGLVNMPDCTPSQLGWAVLHGPTVEVNLTPIAWDVATINQWEVEVSGIRIRAHSTNPARHLLSRKDEFTYDLPREVLLAMEQNLGAATTDYLLGTDLLPQINWKLYDLCNNGGCDLRICAR